jgi:hypothetical protein
MRSETPDVVATEGGRYMPRWKKFIAEQIVGKVL